MSLTTSYDFSVPGNYTYDAAQIVVAGSEAALLLGPNGNLTFAQSFTSSSGFTYDAAKAVFTGSSVAQLDQRPAGATFYAAWTSSLDGNWGGGSPTGTAIGGGAVSGGHLVGDSTSPKGVSYVPSGNLTGVQVGTRRLTIVPQYTGSASVTFYAECANSGAASLLQIKQNGTNLICEVYDHNGAGLTTLAGTFSPVAGTPYEIEVDFDFTGGAQRLFLDGVLLSNDVAVGTRTLSDITQIFVGSSYNGSQGGDSFYTGLVIFSTVQHTANYTPSQAISPTIYAQTSVVLPTFTYPGPGTVQAWGTLTVTDAQAPGYILNSKYWNGSAWVTSDGSPGQSNTAAVAEAHIAALPLSNTLNVKIVFTAGATQQSTSLFSQVYVSEGYSTSDPTIKPSGGLGMSGLVNFAATGTAAGSDGFKFFLLVNGAAKWWTGSAWATSDQSYGQANLAADIAANAAALNLTGGDIVFWVALLHSSAGATTPVLETVTVTYDYFLPPPPGPNLCIVSGYFVGPDGLPLTGSVLTATNPQYYAHGGEMVMAGAVSATVGANGWAELTLLETTTDQVPVLFTLTTGMRVQTFGYAQVPNAASVDFSMLTFAPFAQ